MVTMPQGISFRDAVTEFLLDGQARSFSPYTLRHYRNILGGIGRFLESQDTPIVYIRDIRPVDIRRYLVYRKDSGVRAISVHTEARALRAFLNFCKREGWLETSPFATIQMPRKEQKEPLAFSPEEVKRLYRACQTKRERAIVLLLLDSGIRASELCSLNRGDIGEDGEVRIRSGKGMKERFLYIGAKTRRDVTRYLQERGGSQPGEALFVGERGDRARLGGSGLRKILRNLGRRAGVTGVSPHAFRRTFAIFSLRQGMDIYTLARIMGHSDITVLKHYLAFAETNIKAAQERFGVVGFAI